MSISIELKNYKEKYLLNNKQLANVIGISLTTISKWLKGTTEPKKENRKKVEKLLSLDFYRDNVTELLDSDKTDCNEFCCDANVKDKVEEKNSLEANYEPFRWSVSRVKTWLDNPFDFYCKYIKGLKRDSPWQDALDRGTVLHQYLEELAKGKNPEDIESDIHLVNNEVIKYNEFVESGRKKIDVGLFLLLKEYYPDFEESLLKREKLKELSQKGIDDGIRVARKYLMEYGTVHNMGEVLETEKKIEWDMSEYLPNQSFIGYIDKVVKDKNGNIWLVDHKTYSNKPTFENLRMEIQANVYMWVMKNIYNVDIAGFIYDCINPKEKIVGRGYHFHQFKISYNERIVDMVMENFLTTIEIILNYPDYMMYKESTYGTAFMNELVHGFDRDYTIKITGVEEDSYD